MYRSHCLSIHLLMDMGCFHLLAIVNNAATNLTVQIPLQVCFQFFGVHTQTWNWRISDSSFTFFRNYFTVFHKGCTILHSYQGFQFLLCPHFIFLFNWQLFLYLENLKNSQRKASLSVNSQNLGFKVFQPSGIGEKRWVGGLLHTE